MSYPPGPHVPYGQPVPPVPTPPTAGKATTALVLGVVSLFFCGFFTGIPAILIGIAARREIRQSNGALSGDGLALGGIITGILGTLWTVIAVGILVSLFVFGAQVVEDYDQACDNIRNGQRDDTFFGETISPEDCL